MNKPILITDPPPTPNSLVSTGLSPMLIDAYEAIVNPSSLPTAAHIIDDRELNLEAASRFLAAAAAAERTGLPLAATRPAHGASIDLRPHLPFADMVRPNSQALRASDFLDYELLPAFSTCALRDLVVASNDREEEPNLPSISQAIATLRARGHRDLMIKLVGAQPKAFPVEIIAANDNHPSQDYGLAAIHHGKRSLVQQRVEMTDETRFFVVDAKIVSASLNVAKWTPFDRPQLPMPYGVATTTTPELAARMRAAADHFIAAAAATPTWPRHYVVDLYFDPRRDVIGVVEVNPILASGRYACDGYAITAALVEAMLAPATSLTS